MNELAINVKGDPDTIYPGWVLVAYGKVFHKDTGDLYQMYPMAVLDIRTTACGLAEGQNVDELGSIEESEARAEGLRPCKRCYG